MDPFRHFSEVRPGDVIVHKDMCESHYVILSMPKDEFKEYLLIQMILSDNSPAYIGQKFYVSEQMLGDCWHRCNTEAP